MQADGAVTLETAIEKITPNIKEDSKTWFTEVKDSKAKGTSVIDAANVFGRACGKLMLSWNSECQAKMLAYLKK